ncbi:unnamed protein product [Durusdinium trenchii]|uniref:Uncharacterized protein n=1 Tax=Durusdinium trenchii TaxID=1381693 RepID=A0ABP0IM45_9DINO
MAAVFDEMSPPGLASDRHGVQQREVDKFKAQILQDVGIRLQQAKQETERKVSAELKYLHVAMQEMDQRLDSLNKRLEDVPMKKQDALEDALIVQALAKVEQQWGKELGKLKTELHQMIYAHNHNADLMKHQKETLDKIRQETFARASPALRNTALVKRALAKIAGIEEHLRSSQILHQKMEPLLPRVATLERAVAQWAAPSGGYPFGPNQAPTRPPLSVLDPPCSVPVPPPDYEAQVESPEEDDEDDEEDDEEEDSFGELGAILNKASAVYDTSS